MNICVFGLGKLGLCTAAVLASKGYKVFGYDVNKSVIDGLNKRHIHINENGLKDLLSDCWDNMEFVDDDGVDEAIKQSDVVFVIVPTPSDESGKFSNSYVLSALKTIGSAIAKKDTYTTVAITSTVMPESCEKEFIPTLDKYSGGHCGFNYSLVYNPTFIAIGSVINDLIRPNLVLIGSSDPHSIHIIEDIYDEICEPNVINIKSMNFVNAEISKLALNCFVTTKLSFVNELARICENTMTADASVILNAISNDPRVGSKCMKVGMGFGGPCFPRDNIALCEFANDKGCKAELNEATSLVNNKVVDGIVNVVVDNCTPYGFNDSYEDKVVAIFGLSYKPGTHLVEESQPMDVVKSLHSIGYKVRVHDPQAIHDAKEVLGDSVEYYKDPLACADGADAILILMNWDCFVDYDWCAIDSGTKKGTMLFDVWNQLEHKEFKNLIRIVAGKGCLAK